ncbi:efflux RND transporter periplasmic adaptor subunit [Lysobacter sp. TY2-98]|uniref:efflux RND transporter periplasmic adaptor subunit n=1 Tax=Lysobacter sp. TY2-98 TaxID=2290922 RepID=UPI000E2035DE|nr:efflux RND transporter periplasmic adaptor subunit [Lysobacter sp. TY2-98]AXK71156.1 efflux RND transporter periplasmic adaptor subunit [Lysobacter sp. TY2-98]
MRAILVFPALVAALVLTGCGDRANAAKEGSKGGGDRPVAVTTEVVRSQPFVDTLQALGTVRARESVTVTASVSQKVAAVHFDSGQMVKAGAPLITLVVQSEQAQLRAAEAAAKEATDLYNRQASLADQQLVARSQLDTQRATRDAAIARVAQMRAQLADRVIRAPFAGVLGLRQVSPGSLVTPGTVITTLDDLSTVYVDFPVPETQLAQVSPGESLTGHAAAYPGRSFDGTVATIDARIDPNTRAVTVRGQFPNADRALKPGMLLQVDVARAERPALLIPEIAVVQVGDDTYVYRVKGGAAERADVKVGTRVNGRVEIVSGLAAGDTIVVDGTGKLKPGAKIKDVSKAPRKVA